MLLLLLAALALLAACGGPSENQAIIDATKTYVADNSAVASVDVEVEQVDGDYARAKVMPTDGTVTDPAWVFLKRQSGVWTGLTIGTAFRDEDYQELGIPRSLWL
jgi:hypothetical protein